MARKLGNRFARAGFRVEWRSRCSRRQRGVVVAREARGIVRGRRGDRGGRRRFFKTPARERAARERFPGNERKRARLGARAIRGVPRTRGRAPGGVSDAGGVRERHVRPGLSGCRNRARRRAGVPGSRRSRGSHRRRTPPGAPHRELANPVARRDDRFPDAEAGARARAREGGLGRRRGAVRGAPGDAGPRRRAGNGGFLRTPPRRARGALDGFWGDIRDRAWAVVAAATVVCDSYETQRVALEKALRETERWISADSADASASRATESTDSRNETGPGPSPRDPNERNRVRRGKLENWSWWHRLRLVVLARLDRLDASHASRLGAFKGEAWRRMSAQSAEDAAKSLASRDDARGAASGRARVPAPSRTVASRILKLFETIPSLRTSRFCPGARPGTRAFPARVFNEAVASLTLNRAGFKIGAHRFGARASSISSSRRPGPRRSARTRRRRGVRSSALARAARVSADALAPPRAKAPRRARRGCCVRPSTGRRRRGGGRGARRRRREGIFLAPGHRASPAGTRGGAPPRVACDAAVRLRHGRGAAERAAACPSTELSRRNRDAGGVGVDVRGGGARRPDPRATRGNVSSPAFPRFGTRGFARELDAQYCVVCLLAYGYVATENENENENETDVQAHPRARVVRRAGVSGRVTRRRPRSRSRTARATSSLPNPRSPPPRRVRSFGNRREPAATRFARGW